MDLPKFTDLAGREWTLQIGVTTCKRVRELAGVDLANADAELCHELSVNPEKLVNVLFAIVAPRAQELKISEAAFGESLGGDVLDAAAEATIEAIINFFQKFRRDVLKTTWRKLTERKNQLLTSALTRLNSLDTHLDAAVTEALQTIDQELSQLTVGKPSTN